ncbi:hypothetical protein, partial [Prevotella sp. P4-98]|uniref:hypothetical protein n=1 Tax=Prevotella sp. P4-98 TaxID=2024219 RepID=UPI001C1F8D67
LISGKRPYSLKDFPQRFLAKQLKKSFSKTVICYLLFVTQKKHFWKLSTVTLGDGVIDLSL